MEQKLLPHSLLQQTFRVPTLCQVPLERLTISTLRYFHPRHIAFPLEMMHDMLMLSKKKKKEITKKPI